MRFYLGFLEYSRLTLSSNERRVLEKKEENRLHTLKTNMARQTFLAGRILARNLVADLTGQPVESVKISVDDAGKPGIDSREPIFFSIAHSGGWTVCVASRTSVGLDIEQRYQKRDWRAIVDTYFHPSEQEDVGRILEPEEKSRYFHRLWTVKEAYIKAIGLTVWDVGNLPRIRPHHSEGQEHPNAMSFEPIPDLFLGIYSPMGIDNRDMVLLPRFPGPGDSDWSGEKFIIDAE